MKQIVWALVRCVLTAVLFVGPVSAAAPTDAQMRAAMKAFPELRDLKISEFDAKGDAAHATISTRDGREAALVGYLPAGRRVPVLAVLTPQANVGQMLGGGVRTAFPDLKLADVTAMFVAPGENREKTVVSKLPEVLRKQLAPVIGEFFLSAGINLFGRIDGRPAGLLDDALKLVGLRTVRDLTVQAKIGVTREVIVRKRGAWRHPFQLRDVGGRPTTLEGLTFIVSGSRAKPQIAGWGQLRVNRNVYFMFTKYAMRGKNPGKAYGFDAHSISLRSLADLAAAMPWAGRLSMRGLDRLPLDRMALTNPSYRAFDTKSGARPSFENMMLVAASPGTTLPDQKALPGTRGLARGTVGPALFAQGDARIFGQKVGNIVARMSIHGLVADANMGVKKIGPIRFGGDVAFHLGPRKGDSKLEHEMVLTGKARLHGLGEQTIRLTVDHKKLAYRLPANCPANPLTVSGSVPMTAGLVLDGIRDFKIDAGISDCYSAAILGVVKNPARLVGFAKGATDEMAGLGKNAAKELAGRITHADETLKSAWKGSVSAGQTAASTVQNLDRKIASLGSQINRTGNEIKKIGKSIKKLGKKIGSLFKKKKKKKKRERARKQAQKRKLEQQRRSARAARAQAAKALGSVSPYFNPTVVEARTALSGLRYERKLAEARSRYARQLQKDFADSGKRRRIMALVDAGALMRELLPAGGSAGAMLADIKESETPVKVGVQTSFSELNAHLVRKRGDIEEQIVTAALEAAMERHLAGVRPDPEFEIPVGKPVRIIGEHNMCLEAYRWGKVKGLRGIGALRADIRIDYCHTDTTRSEGAGLLSTQRFRFTSAGNLQAVFGREAVCFNAQGDRVETSRCDNGAQQVFFVDPSVDAIRPLVSARKGVPQCVTRRHAARPGAQLQLDACDYGKTADAVAPRQTWKVASWNDRPPPRKKLPMLESLWGAYGQGYAAPEIRSHNGAVSIAGMIRIYPRDKGGKALDFREPIDVLPPNQRPDRRLVFNVNAHNAPARVDILPNGRVLWVAGTRRYPWVSLGNINFVTRGMKPLSLKNGCRKSKWKAYRDPSYAKKGDTVYLGGLISCSFNSRKPMAVLPEGMRPDGIRVFNVGAHEQSARVDVYPNGEIRWMAGGGTRHGWVSLEGVSFNLPTPETTRLPMSKGCRAYGGSYAPPRMDMIDGEVRLSGLVNCASSGGSDYRIAVLPKGMRPAGRLIFDQNVHQRGVRLDILPNGNINLRGTMPNKWVSLEGMVFSTRGASPMKLHW